MANRKRQDPDIERAAKGVRQQAKVPANIQRRPLAKRPMKRIKE